MLKILTSFNNSKLIIMKKSILLYLIVLFCFGCSSSYKNMQTPDDVYYSPGFYKSRNSDSLNKKDDAPRNSSVVNNDRPTYHRDYDDDYYYNRRRVYYDNETYSPNKTLRRVTSPRTTNLGGYVDKKPDVTENYKYKNRKINPTDETEKSGKPVRTFKKTNTFIGNAVKAIINSATNYNNSNYNNSNSTSSSSSSTSSNSNTKSTTTTTTTTPSKSTSAPVRTFEKKN